MSSTYSVSLQLQAQNALQQLKGLVSSFKKLDKEVDKTDDALSKFEKNLKDSVNATRNSENAINKKISGLRKLASNLDRSSAKFRIVNEQIKVLETRRKLCTLYLGESTTLAEAKALFVRKN